TVTDDFPTPPFPDATASTRVVVGTAVAGASSRAFQRARAITADFSAGSISAMVSVTPATPGNPPRRPRTSRSIWSRSGQPAMVSATATSTTPSGRTSRWRTMPRSTMSAPSSGSTTARRASRASSTVGAGGPGGPGGPGRAVGWVGVGGVPAGTAQILLTRGRWSDADNMVCSPDGGAWLPGTGRPEARPSPQGQIAGIVGGNCDHDDDLGEHRQEAGPGDPYRRRHRGHS